MLVLYFQRGFLLYLFYGVVQYLTHGYNAGIRVFLLHEHQTFIY